MLNWLKRRAKISFNNRYTNILRRSESPEMFLTEQSMLNQQPAQTESIKLLIFNNEGQQYTLDVPLEMTLDRIKIMAIGHFYTPLEAVGGSSHLNVEGGCSKVPEGGGRYRLVLAKDYRTLSEENSVLAEELIDNDEILLLECRRQLLVHPKYVNIYDDMVPMKDLIERHTAKIDCRNWDREAESVNSTLDFKIALRQILITMIEASIHLIAPEDNASDLFVLVFELLEKRHKPRVDKNSLKQLTEMGFSEARAIKALQFKTNVVEAMEWLLDETLKHQNGSDSSQNDVLLLSPEGRKTFFMAGKDPAKKVMQEFKKYVEKWFVPDSRALQNLMSTGYGEDLAKEALRISCNNEKLAMEFLEGKSNLGDNFQKGFQRDSPIMSAILDSPIVQVALSKPKTLFALMVLCETPNNVNVWLSDPETHPVVSQVLRIYHAEKHRLNTYRDDPDERMEDETSPAHGQEQQPFATMSSPSSSSSHTGDQQQATSGESSSRVLTSSESMLGQEGIKEMEIEMEDDGK